MPTKLFQSGNEAAAALFSLIPATFQNNVKTTCGKHNNQNSFYLNHYYGQLFFKVSYQLSFCFILKAFSVVF